MPVMAYRSIGHCGRSVARSGLLFTSFTPSILATRTYYCKHPHKTPLRVELILAMRARKQVFG